MDDEVMRVVDGRAVRRYVAKGGVGCFFCGSESVEGQDIDTDAGWASQGLFCKRCGASWKDLFSLTGVEVGGVSVFPKGK